MRGLPYVPWFHGDFLRSTQGWTLIEQAVYWMLLCTQADSGTLPEDPERLASIANTDVATLKSVWPLVGKKFVRTRAGLINKRMQGHRRKYFDFKRRQSEGGKKGMASRYGKARADSKVIEFQPGKDKSRG